MRATYTVRLLSIRPGGDRQQNRMTDQLEEGPEFWQALRESARLLQTNRPAEAIELLEPLYRRAPTQADVAINLGGAYILQRKWNRAVRVLSRAAEANPNNSMVWMNLAAAHLGALETAGPEQQRRAIAAYEQVLLIDPQAPNVHYHLGLIYKERGELEQAATYFQKALTVAPHDRDARRWLDQVMAAQMEQARRNQRQLAASEPDGEDEGRG
jgi:tetratricopeptide (TPR) repeat protein